MSRVFALADLFGSWIIGNLERFLEKHASVTFAFLHYLNISTTISKFYFPYFEIKAMKKDFKCVGK